MKRLHANESPYEKRLGALTETLEGLCLNEYPDEEALALRLALSRYAEWPVEGIVCGNGSDELIKMCLEAFSVAGDKVLSHGPTFVEYRIMTEIRGAQYIETLPSEDMTLDQASFIEKIECEKPAIIFLCNPNNPTGESLSQTFIEKVLEKAQGKVILDEAYSEFGGETFIRRLPQYPQLVILRTLSKAFGLAAIRVGYALTSTENVAALERVRMPYNVTALSQALAVLVLSDVEIMKSEVAKTLSERSRIYKILTTLKGITPINSNTNFILVKTSSETLESVKVSMGQAGLKLRYFDADDMLKAYFRITIGKKEDNDLMLRILEGVLS